MTASLVSYIMDSQDSTRGLQGCASIAEAVHISTGSDQNYLNNIHSIRSKQVYDSPIKSVEFISRPNTSNDFAASATLSNGIDLSSTSSISDANDASDNTLNDKPMILDLENEQASCDDVEMVTANNEVPANDAYIRTEQWAEDESESRSN